MVTSSSLDSAFTFVESFGSKRLRVTHSRLRTPLYNSDSVRVRVVRVDAIGGLSSRFLFFWYGRRFVVVIIAASVRATVRQSTHADASFHVRGERAQRPTSSSVNEIEPAFDFIAKNLTGAIEFFHDLIPRVRITFNRMFAKRREHLFFGATVRDVQQLKRTVGVDVIWLLLGWNGTHSPTPSTRVNGQRRRKRTSAMRTCLVTSKRNRKKTRWRKKFANRKRVVIHSCYSSSSSSVASSSSSRPFHVSGGFSLW